jgi:CRP/FNR family transcriptional regulator
VDVQSVQTACQQCGIREHCLPSLLGQSDLERFGTIVERKRPLSAGEFLFRSRDPFHVLYIVRTGLVKTSLLERNGDEHIAGFHFPGDIIGLDAIAAGTHACSGQALSDTDLCEIPYNRLEELAATMPGLQQRLLWLMSREVCRDEQERRSQAQTGAAPRLAAFLLDVSGRFAELGRSGSSFGLPISNQDLARFLGLAPETVSRLFRRFREQGLVSARSKKIHIHDREGLEAVAQGGEGR